MKVFAITKNGRFVSNRETDAAINFARIYGVSSGYHAQVDKRVWKKGLGKPKTIFSVAGKNDQLKNEGEVEFLVTLNKVLGNPEMGYEVRMFAEVDVWEFVRSYLDRTERLNDRFHHFRWCRDDNGIVTGIRFSDWDCKEIETLNLDALAKDCGYDWVYVTMGKDDDAFGAKVFVYL